MFANELQTLPIPQITCYDVTEAAPFGILNSFSLASTTGIGINTFDLDTKQKVNNTFSLLIF